MADEELEEESALSSIKEHLTHLGTKVDHLKDTVKEHITKDKQYYSLIDTIVAAKEEGIEMEDSAGLVAAMLAGRGEGGGALGGAGGGFAGAALGSLLLGRGGLLGGVGNGVVGEGCVTPSQLTAALAGVQDTQMNTAVLQTLGAIQGSIPLAEGQVQLALAGATGEIRSHLGQVENGLVSGQTMINKNISDAIASSLASQNSIKESIAAYGVANLNATKDAQFAIATIVKDDGEKTRALITSNTISELQRQLTVSQTAALEDRLTNRARETEINITNTNTATSQQAQVQLQAQQQAQLQIQTIALLQNLIGDTQAIRQGSVVFNSGTMAASGNQTAANTKVA